MNILLMGKIVVKNKLKCECIQQNRGVFLKSPLQFIIGTVSFLRNFVLSNSNQVTLSSFKQYVARLALKDEPRCK